MIRNTIGGIREANMFALLEQLPAVVRHSLAEADYSFCVGPVLRIFEASGAAAAIAAIYQADFDAHLRVARRERRTVFGRNGRPIR